MTYNTVVFTALLLAVGPTDLSVHGIVVLDKYTSVLVNSTVQSDHTVEDMTSMTQCSLELKNKARYV